MSFAGESVHRCRCYGEGDGLHGKWYACPPELCEADALLAEVERLTAERDAALHRAEGWVQHDTEAYAAQSMRALKRAEAAERERDELLTFWPDKYDELQVKVQEWATRARAAEALAERRLADLRTYWTHCGYPEWYGDEERAWLHAALTDAGPDNTEEGT